MKEKGASIIDILKNRYPDALCALHYKKDNEPMIAVRLSAQCTDARVNLVTPALFAAYPTLETMAAADIGDVENYVRSSIKETARLTAFRAAQASNCLNTKMVDRLRIALKT